jgi:hypothetical protein
MIDISVQGLLFSLSQDDIKDSRVIQDQIQYKEHYNFNEPIVIDVPLHDWYEYLQFLKTGQASVAALKVIDYLENVQQVRMWFFNRYQTHDESENNILKTINDNTVFTMEQIFPIITIKNDIDMIPYLNVPRLPKFYIERILYRHNFERYKYSTYTELIRNSQFRDISASLLNKANEWFIITQSLDQQDIVNSTNIKTHSRINRVNKYIAQYYSNVRFYPDISVTSGSLSAFKNLVIYGPSDKPYLVEVNPLAATDNTQPFLLWTADANSERYTPINIYNPNSPYKPYNDHTGYNVGTTVDGYSVYSFNPPSVNGRDYYIFYPILNDPISKITYVVSI